MSRKATKDGASRPSFLEGSGTHAPDEFVVTERGDGWVTFKCRIQPGASRSAIAGTYADALKISICAPPIEGRANEELIKFLSKRLEIPRASVSIISGETSRTKLIKCRLSRTDFLACIRK